MLKNVVIMAGGQSRRFKRDKTLELFDGRRLIEYPVDEFRGRAENLAVVAKNCEKYSFLGINCIKDAYEAQCPMVGILTALKYFKKTVFVVAADTPFVKYEHAEKLFSALGGADAAIPFISGRHHPLYACYGTGMTEIFEEYVTNGQYRLMDALWKKNVVYLNEIEILSSENEKKSFININTEDDLKSIL